MLTGISIGLFLSGCGKEDVEYRMTVDLRYVNQTDSLIRFEISESINSNNVSIIELSPSAESKIFSYDYEGVEKDVTPVTCCNDFLTNVYSQRESNGSSKKLNLNETLCVTHLNEKSTEISNYDIAVISDRHFRYTYTLKKEDFENAKTCE